MLDALERGVSAERPFETRWRTKSDNELWIEGRAVLIQWNSLPTVFMTVRDITEAKLRELAMQQDAEHLRRENVNLRSSIKDRFRLGNIIGKSRAMQEVYERILNAAATKANVIIYGESGTGKELVARAIHDRSARCKKPFVPVNCAAIPETPSRERILRPQERGIYRGPRGQAGLPGRAHGRHALSGRGGGVETEPAGQTLACHRGWRLHTRREHLEQGG